MGWLNLGALAFGAGAAIPIIIHLLHRQKYKRVRWAAMDWLLAAIRKTRRRLQFENLILLLVRILVMLLLAFALARPFVKSASGSLLGERDTHYVFAIDTSYSMEYRKGQGQNSSFDKAKKACLELLETIPPAEKDRSTVVFTVVSLSEHSEAPLVGWNDRAQVKKAIEDLKVRPAASNMHVSMLDLGRLLDPNAPSAPKNADRRVYLFTDLQRNGWEFAEPGANERFRELLKKISHQDRTWFHLIDVGTSDAPNRAIVDLRVANKILTVKRPAEVQVDLYNFSPRAAEGTRVQLLVDGRPFETKPVPLPPGVVTTVSFTYPFGPRDAGPHLFEARFDKDDRYDYPSTDNHRYLAVEVKEAVRALLIDGEPKDGRLLSRETGTLELALRTTGIFKVTWIPTHNFDEQKLEEYDFVALCNVKSLDSLVLAKIEEFVARGGGLFVSLGNQTDSIRFNQDLARCNGDLVEESGGVRKCRKCGSANVPDPEVTTVKRIDPSSKKEVGVPIHGEGRGLVPVRLGERVGTPPDLNQSGVPLRLSKVDLDHKIFSLFRDVARAQPYSLVFWKHFKLEGVQARHEGDRAPRVLAELGDADRSAMMVEGRWHEGRVILFASAIDAEPDWNSGVPGRAPYIPIVQNLGEYLAARSSERLNFQVGEPLLFYAPKDPRRSFLLYPPTDVADRKPDAIMADVKEQDRFMKILYEPDLTLKPIAGKASARGLRVPGGYTLRRVVREGGDTELRCESCKERAGEFARHCAQCGKLVVPELVAAFAANVGPRDTKAESLRFSESNLETISRAQLREQYREFRVEFVGEKNEKGDEIRIDSPSELWRKILFALLGFLILESLLAALFGRSKQ